MIAIQGGVQIRQHVTRTRLRALKRDRTVAIGQHRVQIGRRRIQGERAVQSGDHQRRIIGQNTAVVAVIDIAGIRAQYRIEHCCGGCTTGAFGHRERAGGDCHGGGVVGRGDSDIEGFGRRQRCSRVAVNPPPLVIGHHGHGRTSSTRGIVLIRITARLILQSAQRRTQVRGRAIECQCASITRRCGDTARVGISADAGGCL